MDSSQPATDSAVVSKPKTYFEVGSTYINDNVYLGRKDSVNLPYLTPSIGYYARSGFFANASFGFLANSSNSRLDVVSLMMGYSFACGHYEGELTGSKYFYNSQSTSVKSEVQASLDYFSEYDLGFIRPSLSVTVNFGNKLDLASAVGLEHSFTLFNEKAEITPAFIVNGSTQNFYSDYYKIRRYNPKRKTARPANSVGSISGEVVNAGSFKVLDYEFSTAIKYSFGKCALIFVPVYAIPVHPSEIIAFTKLNNGSMITKTSTEKLQNNFFGTFEFNLKF